jgi:hypothetical protein
MAFGGLKKSDENRSEGRKKFARLPGARRGAVKVTWISGTARIASKGLLDESHPCAAECYILPFATPWVKHGLVDGKKPVPSLPVMMIFGILESFWASPWRCATSFGTSGP